MSWSARVVLGGVLVGLVACEAPPPQGACGGFVCVEGERCDRETLTCLPDQAPVVTLVAPTEVVTSGTFTVTGSVTDDVEVKTATWAFAGAGAQPLELSAEGRFSLTVAAPAVDEQAFDLVVTASDGPRSSNALSIVRVDRVGPALALLSPDAGVTVGGSDTALLVEVRATDASGALDALRIGSTDLASPLAGSVASAVVDIPGLNAQPFEVQVRATDAHGNETVQAFSFVADRVSPDLHITAPLAGATLSTATYRVAGTGWDPTGPLRAFARVGSDPAAFVEGTVSADGGWVVDVPVPELEDPLAQVEVHLLDGLSNRGVKVVGVKVDRVAPTVTLTGPGVDSIHRQALSVTATTDAQAVSVVAQLGTGAPVALGGGPTSWAGQVPPPSQDYGPLLLRVTATDAAGNAAAAQRQVIIDTVAPVITFTAPAAGRRFKIADFATTNDVAVSWQVQDADPQAAVTQVNGATSTATQLLVTTSAADNGRVVTTTVSATDQAGNLGSSSLSFSVDRVAPAITGWVPAAAARNIEPRTTSVSFSEPVFGATTSTEALVLSPASPVPGSWNTAHTTWTSAALTPYAVYDATLAALADDHGNPVPPPPGARQFHTAALATSTPPTAPLATGVAEFRVVADADGVATVAYRTTAQAGSGQTTFAVHRVSPQTMTLEAELSSSTLNVTSFGLNAWSVVNGSTLASRNIAAYSWTTPMTAGPSPLTHQRRVESGAPTSVPYAVGSAAALSVLPFAREADQSEFGHVEGVTFTRGGNGVALPIAVDHHVAQGSDSWAGFRLDAAAVRWVRFRCNRYAAPAPGYYQCEGIAYGAPTSSTPSALSAAMNRTGTCLIASWSEGGQRRALAQPLPSCDGAPTVQCPSNTNVSSTSQAAGFSVAPWSVGSTSSLIAAYQDGFTVRLGTLSDPATCNLSFTNLGAALVAQPIAWAPVQLGQKAALFYLDSSNALRVYVP